MRHIAPSSEQELAEVIATATQAFVVEGLGSKRALGHAPKADTVLSLSRFSGVTLYEPEELVLEAGAATPLADIEALLAKHSQRLAFEPPDYSRLLRSNQRGSLGSVLMCNLSGSRRLTAGAARDHILGIRGVSGRGEIFKAGGRVVKNVTGYDVSKLMAGSFGTLAALTSVTFKVLPKSETEITLLYRPRDVHHAGEIMRLAMQSPYDVSSAAYDPKRGAGLRLEGIAASVEDRKLNLIKLIGGDAEVLPEVHSQQFWTAMRNADAHAEQDDALLWRISVSPTDGPQLAAALASTLEGSFTLDWSGGLIWLQLPADANCATVRAQVGMKGHAMLVRAPDDVKQMIDVFEPQPAPLAALAGRTKQAFDPKGLLNPFKMSRAF